MWCFYLVSVFCEACGRCLCQVGGGERFQNKDSEDLVLSLVPALYDLLFDLGQVPNFPGPQV